jgi:hypothetical protein
VTALIEFARDRSAAADGAIHDAALARAADAVDSSHRLVEYV